MDPSSCRVRRPGGARGALGSSVYVMTASERSTTTSPRQTAQQSTSPSKQPSRLGGGRRRRSSTAIRRPRLAPSQLDTSSDGEPHRLQTWPPPTRESRARSTRSVAHRSRDEPSPEPTPIASVRRRGRVAHPNVTRPLRHQPPVRAQHPAEAAGPSIYCPPGNRRDTSGGLPGTSGDR